MESPRGVTLHPVCSQAVITLIGFAAILIEFVWLIILSSIAIIAKKSSSGNSPDYSPNVLLIDSPKPPSGYRYGGALDSGRGSWVKIPSLPEPISDITSESYGDKVLLFGGLTRNFTINPHLYIFHSVFKNYTVVNTTPNPVYRAAHVLVNDKLYLFGGYNTYDGGENGHPTNQVRCYDIKTGIWSSLKELSIARGDTAAEAYDSNTIYLFGGYGEEFSQDKTGTLCEKYDISRNSYTTCKNMPTPRGDLNTVKNGNSIYVIGGYRASDDSFVKTFEVFHPDTNSWSNKAEIPIALGDFGLVKAHNHVYIIGGELFSGYTAQCPWGPCRVNEIPSHSVFLYDEVNDHWIRIAPLQQARFRIACAVYNNTLFAFGGSTENEIATDSVEAYPIVDDKILYYHYKN